MYLHEQEMVINNYELPTPAEKLAIPPESYNRVRRAICMNDTGAG